VTNVISAWHRGFKPIQPPTHRPPLRLCHHNPQAGFLLPRWAGDSMCEQNSTARAAGGHYYLFPGMTKEGRAVGVLSYCTNTFQVRRDVIPKVQKYCRRWIMFFKIFFTFIGESVSMKRKQCFFFVRLLFSSSSCRRLKQVRGGVWCTL